jgi:hypothetical protein
MVAQKVAQLYARNPRVEAVRRQRLDFQVWDGDIETLTEAYQALQQSLATGVPNLGALVVMRDFTQGRQQQRKIERFCRTLEVVDQYDIDCSFPDFKEQMKQLVRRVVICGVAYARPSFVRTGEETPGVSTVDTRGSLFDRQRMMAAMQNRIVEDDMDEGSPEYATMQNLAVSLGVSSQKQDDYSLPERVEHDFLPSTSVIPDERCRHLKDFVAARWLFIEYNLPAEDVNEIFGLVGEDRVCGGTQDAEEREKELKTEEEDSSDPCCSANVRLIEILDAQTRTRAFVAKGHDKYILPFEPLDPCYPGFWPLVSLTFNDVEVDESCERASIFPPSDVDLIRDSQSEWNRTREANRDQRNANAPKYVVRKGVLSPNDIEKLRTAEPNSVVELENVPSDREPSQLIQVLQVAHIDPALYETRSLEQDFLLTSGVQQANIGPAQPDVTATVGTIAEQSRMSVASSNVDDLDSFLSKLARMRGHLRMQGMSAGVVKMIAGPGAVWPTLEMPNYLSQVYLTIVASSSGRPNRALEIANFERIAPILMQSGANPVAIIEEAIRRLGDERMDVQKFYPLPGTALAGVGPGGPPQVEGRSEGPESNSAMGTMMAGPITMGPQQPLQPNMTGAAIPLPAA